MKRRLWLVMALLPLLFALKSCSLVYVCSYEKGDHTVTEFGLLGLPNPQEGPPGGLLPLYRRATPPEPWPKANAASQTGSSQVASPVPRVGAPETPQPPLPPAPPVVQASPSYSVDSPGPAGIVGGFARYETARGVHLTSDWGRLGEGASLGNIPSGAHVAFRNLKFSCPTHFYILSFAPSEPYLACLFPNLGTDEQGNTATNPLRPNQPYSFPGREVSYPVGQLPQGVKSQEETVYLVTSGVSRPDLLEACAKFADAIQNRRSAEAHEILKAFEREMAHPKPTAAVKAVRFAHVGQ